MYVKEQGARVMRDGERIAVGHKGKRLQEMPVMHLDQLVLLGNVQLTTQAAALLLEKRVDVVFLSSYWKFRGRLVHTGSKHARLRHAQMERMSQKATALPIAQTVVGAKIHNQRVLLQRQAGNLPGNRARDRIRRSLDIMKRAEKAAAGDQSLESLRGHEGSAGAAYFAAIGALLAPEWGFKGRNYHPPLDPFNALLSFGYTLLLKDVTAAVQLVGLDPYLGFLHVIHYGRPALCLDLMEEFRPVLVDAMVLDLVNRRMLRPDDFKRTKNPRRPVELGPAGCLLVMEQYERRLYTKVQHVAAHGETAYRRVLELQARQLAKVILDKAKRYQPFLIR